MSVLIKDLKDCSEFLKNGNVVAFPTETVYGLGANAFDLNAVKKIYLAKDRPITDPIILHVNKFENIIDLVDLTNEELDLVKKISDKFWPGPLSMILKASDKIPKLITANSAYVGIRIPNNKEFFELSENCGFPIAAPSANKFEHCSTTHKNHIITEFKDNHKLNESIYLLDSDEPCQIGIESTILEFDFNKKVIEIVRPGFITIVDLQDLNIPDYSVLNNYEHDSSRHYSINCKTISIKIESKDNISKVVKSFRQSNGLIDMGNLFFKFKDKLNCYDDLSSELDVIEMMSTFYDKLRKFENKVDILYIVDNEDNISIDQLELYKSLSNRIKRASYGNFVEI